ncbi:unnamed protein product [Mytilus edulis]|uniref:Ig-like domain-containing protein n=1 Tax=Mytilus edulis TaxID=6550 RepID=A0A8S3RWE3_MYTED|nr:unnamed protein product [Mytilus edulis]
MCFCMFYLALTKEIIYKTLGSKVKLVCPFETTRDITWFGPLKYTIYSVGTDVEPAVSTLVEINKNTTDNKSILIINRLIESIRGEFKCSDGVNESEFNLLIKRNPSDLVIVNATGDKITSVQGREHTLECTVTSGQPGGNITWSTDGAVVAKMNQVWLDTYLRLTDLTIERYSNVQLLTVKKRAY